MNCNSRRQKIRAVFAVENCIHPGSVYDPISARVAEDIGFEAGMFAGSIASLTVLGAPDLIVLTLSEFADQAHRICRAGELPLIVDADHGYGNALNVRRTVEELESAGVACLTIEDTLLPQRFGQSAVEFLEIGEGVGKMKAALDARQDAQMIVLGRTSAVGPNGVDDGIQRAAAYLDAGVDGIMFVGVKTRAELEPIARAIDAPIIEGPRIPFRMRGQSQFTGTPAFHGRGAGDARLSASVTRRHAASPVAGRGFQRTDAATQPRRGLPGLAGRISRLIKLGEAQ
jgi:carboxyvinyl-carboxyphosphonate phosphorylmutase